MVAPVVAREGCWVGGLSKTGFAVQCRNDAPSSQAATLKVNVYADKNYEHEVTGYSSTSEILSSIHHFRATVYIDDLKPNTHYWWRVSMVEVAVPNDVTLGDEKTFSAGCLKTLPEIKDTWKIGYFGCTAHSSLFFDDGALRVAKLWYKASQENFLAHIHQGDIYYPDIGETTVGYTDYAQAHFKRPASHADADAAAFRTSFINSYSGLTYNGPKITNSMARNYSLVNEAAKFKSSVPCYAMWDDHDRAFNDCSDRANATGAKLNRWNTGRDVGHEVFMNLNKSLIDSDTDSNGVARNFTAYSSEDAYYIIDIEPVRFIVLDCRTYRDLYTEPDVPNKSMLGAEQKDWFKARVDDNPHKYLIICNGIMFDGAHGWEESYLDGWVNYSFERDELLNYIWQNGDASRTISLVGDTHEAGVFKFRGPNNSHQPVYEILCGNSGWNGSYHGFISGLKAGVSGNGAELEAMFTGSMGYISIEHVNSDLVISLVCASTAMLDGQPEGVIWMKVFK